MQPRSRDLVPSSPCSQHKGAFPTPLSPHEQRSCTPGVMQRSDSLRLLNFVSLCLKNELVSTTLRTCQVRSLQCIAHLLSAESSMHTEAAASSSRQHRTANRTALRLALPVACLVAPYSFSFVFYYQITHHLINSVHCFNSCYFHCCITWRQEPEKPAPPHEAHHTIQSRTAPSAIPYIRKVNHTSYASPSLANPQ